MLLIPDYLLFTTDKPASGRISVSVDFDDPVAKMPDRYIERDLLKQMIHAISQDTLRFISFDEHPKRIVAIRYASGQRRGIITVKSLTPSDCFPREWRSIPIEHDDGPAKSLMQFHEPRDERP